MKFSFPKAKCLMPIALLCCSAAMAGGSWLVDGQAVQTLELQTSNVDTNALYTDGTRTMQAPLAFDPSVSSPVTGLFKATVPWDAEYDFFAFNPANETVVLSPTVASLGFEAAYLAMHGYGVISMPDEGSYISFEERSLGGGGWVAATVMDDPGAIMNRSYADNRYHQRSSITTPLKFDPSLSSSVNGLFKATVPWDAEYEFFTFNPTYETVVLSPTVSSLGFEAGNLVMYGYGMLRLSGESTYISFEERVFAGGGWFVSSVEDDPSAILNRSYADSRYIQRTEGITINHTIQAGDILQIQNGIITAINP